MASYEQVVKFENEKHQGVIRLVEANGFYRAYNHSAYLFCSKDGCGLPIGNLSSQLFSNIYLGAFIKPFRTYVAAHSLRRIRAHLYAVTPRMRVARAQAVVNSSLGVLSHYDSHCVRKVLVAKSRLLDLGRISEDGLRFYPNALDWRLYRMR